MILQLALAIIATSICLLLSTFYAYRILFCHRLFKRIGISGPEPHWLYGNTMQVINNKRPIMLQKWRKEYGDIFGIYDGSTPILVVSSIEGVEQVCVKQYWNFQGHSIGPIQPDPLSDSKNSIFAVDVLFAWGPDWKKLRTNINPCFSTGKLKSYIPLVNKSQSLLMKILDKKAKTGETFDIYGLYQRLTLDITSAVAFGTEVDSLDEKSEAGGTILPIIQNTLRLFSDRPKIMDILAYLPEVAKVIKPIVRFQTQYFGGGVMAPWAEMNALSRQVVLQRATNVTLVKQDIMQSLIENSTLFDGESKQSADVEKLTIDEVVTSTMVFFGAGTETSSTMLGFVSYLLAENQDVQGKLYQEIAKTFPTKESSETIDYDAVMTLPYLDWVCKETLRFFPIGGFGITRFIMDDTEVCGVPIFKHTGFVLINVFAIHNDPQLWGPVDPTKFYPERFSPENSVNRPDAAFLGFGYGPRTCVGMRLALLAVKSTLVKLLFRYRIHPPENGYPEPSEDYPSSRLQVKSDGLVTPSKDVPVRLVPRM